MIVRSVLAKVGYGLCCVAAASALVVSHSINNLVSDIRSIGGSDAITSGPSSGPMNILLMGLESRTDYNGNVIDHHLAHIMHTGNAGGQDTNTLILIHIFNGGTRAVGFSIPRDDWVTYPHTYDGQTQGKVDQAYGDAWAQSLNQTVNDTSLSHDQKYLQANEAGQLAAIQTVESITGVHIDHFAEVNLVGFYELAQTFGGIEACVKPWNGGQNLHDANSGANLKTGYQHLDAAQSLAFVRERDNLPQGDLDRTHRQQAVVDYVMWKVKHEGIFTSFGQLTSMLGQAKRFIITDQGWDLVGFAGEMHALTGKNMTFYTAPVVTTDGHMDGQDVNLIDVPTIQRTVKNAFYPPPPVPTGKSKTTPPPSYPLSDTTVDVYNAGYTAHLARDVADGLTGAGFKEGQVGQATSHQSATQVLYGSGAAAAANAAKVAALFGVTAAASSSVGTGQVEVVLGLSAKLPASFSSLTSSGGSSSGSGGSPSGSGGGSSGGSGGGSSTGGTSTGNDGQSGGVVSVTDSAPYGIPCVY